MRTSSKRVEVSDPFSREYSFSHDNSEEQEPSVSEPRKYWEVNSHCESVRLPVPMPEIFFDTPSSNYHYQRLATSRSPDQQMCKLITQAHYHALARLNRSKLQVRNFILPVQLIKMKDMDPMTRQKITEDLCKYLSFQQELCNVVLEQAKLKFQELCHLLVAIASSSRIKALFLWHVLDSCEKPFQGPLQSDTVLDDLPRIPFTYNPGGRKYLRDLREKAKEKYSERSNEVSGSERLIDNDTTVNSDMSLQESYTSENFSIASLPDKAESKDLLNQLKKVESMVIKCLTDSSTGNMACQRIKKEFVHPVAPESYVHVYSQADVGIQCTISQDFEEVEITRAISRLTHLTYSEQGSVYSAKEDALKSTRLQFCKNYLKFYEHTKISLSALREIYMITLSTLTHLTQLAVNYCMLADGTGKALLSIGSITKGKLRELKLLCEPDDVPSPIHQLYDDGALHAIPDLIWRKVEEECPDLKVHIICVSMSAYSVTQRFVTKSVPLNSFHMENGFCPLLASPQLLIFSTLKCLWLDHVETLEHVNFTLWHSTGRIDSSLEKLIKNTRLISFAYQGPLQQKSTVSKLCDAALSSSRMNSFKLMIQGDPCFPHVAKELSQHLYNDYKQRFNDKSIHFVLGTFVS